MTAIGRLIHRYAIWIVGVWALAAIIGNNFAPPLEQVITAEDQPFSPAGTATSRAVERSAAAFSQAPGDNIGYLVLERNGVLNDQDRAYYDALVVALRRDSRHVIEVVDWWGTPAIAEVARSDDHHAVTAALRFGGMVGTSQAGESITAARSIVTQLHPRRFARIRHRSWRHHRGRVRGNRQTDPAHYGNDNRGVTDPLVDRLPIRDHRDGAVVVGRRFPSRGQADRFRPCRPRFHRDIPVFPRT